jgi:hypothetical protein
VEKGGDAVVGVSVKVSRSAGIRAISARKSLTSAV